MPRCRAKTTSGRRCLNHALKDDDYCAVHRSEGRGDLALAIGAGALVGNALVPGLGGALFGGLAGSLYRDGLREKRGGKMRVFVSFDFDNDRALKDFILGQAKKEDSPFEVIDHSLKEAAPERDWENKARAAIARSDLVLVMVGPKTHRAQGVRKEVAMARSANVKIVQIIGYRDGDYTPVPNAGRLYSWNWPNLKKLLS
jgi:MTH538 TIR-like domain (DUF1863)